MHVTTDSKQYLIITVYMPPYNAGVNCDEVYGDILAEMSQLTRMHADANVIIMGDWNTDFCRSNQYNFLLNSFLQSDELTAAYHFPNSDINFTYISPDGLHTSYIDHFILDPSLYQQLTIMS